MATVTQVPVTQLYKHIIDTSESVHSFTIKDDDKDPYRMWTIIMYPGIYIGTIGMIFVVCIGVYWFKRFLVRPATPRCQPYFPISSQHAIVDDDVEVAPIYRCGGMVEELRRPHKNHDLCIEWEARRWESHCKQPPLAKGVPITGSLAPKAKSQEFNSTNGLL